MIFNAKGQTQVISYIVQFKDISILKDGNFDETDFSDDKQDLVKFIIEHTEQYGNVPDENTVIGKFPDHYDRVQVTESLSYLMSVMEENAKVVGYSRVLNDVNDRAARGLIGMDEVLAITMAEVEKVTQKGNKSFGVDITKDVTRVDRYEDKKAGIGSKIYKTGIHVLDDAFGGILADDLVAIAGRLSHGKTWALNLLSAIFYQQGLSVLFYSGEMEADQIAYRFDSIVSGVSSGSLMWGNNLKYRDKHTEYDKHIEQLKDADNFFTVVTPNDFGGLRPTTRQFDELIDKLKPDMVFVDQLSLMSDWEKAREERIKFGNITRDLRLLSSKHLIPIFLAVQANREATARDEDGDYILPEENQIAESDLVAQHATRVITLCKSNQPQVSGMNLMKMGVKKNRHGEYPEWEMMVHYDTGLFIEKEETYDEEFVEGIDFKSMSYTDMMETH